MARTKLAVVNRVFVNGEADIPAARSVQAGIHMLPLSVFQRQGLTYEVPKTDPSRLEEKRKVRPYRDLSSRRSSTQPSCPSLFDHGY
jgi:hypothetical protein